MPTIQATKVRQGTLLMLEGVPYRVLAFEHRTPGNKRGFVQTKLRNLLDGTQREAKLRSSEFLEMVQLDTREMDFLYSDGQSCVFMDAESFEQHSIDGETVGDAAAWLAEGMRVGVEFLDGRPIGVQLPTTVEVTVREAETVVKGQTAARSRKPAVLENDVRIQVPSFINAGDRIRVDPLEGRYVDRVKG